LTAARDHAGGFGGAIVKKAQGLLRFPWRELHADEQAPSLGDRPLE
jgi:hypothetical protein